MRTTPTLLVLLCGSGNELVSAESSKVEITAAEERMLRVLEDTAASSLPTCEVACSRPAAMHDRQPSPHPSAARGP